MTYIRLPITLSASSAGTSSSASAPVSILQAQHIVPVGASFSAHARRVLTKSTWAQDDEYLRKIQEDIDSKKEVVFDDGVGEEIESAELLARDPKQWKTQDHYAVLGLTTLRYKATQDQIMRAHRKKVLRHHPDKKSNQKLKNVDWFFKCVGIAFELLSNPERRRQFDSVDDMIDDSVPSDNLPADKFYSAWGPVFVREGRFSKKQPVPLLGDENSPRAEVDAFYNFWYSFDSWRSFEYLDKEVNEGSDNRDEKRYQEKKNKADRAAKKSEDNTRFRIMVDSALRSDPRMAMFKAQEKAAKEAKRKAKSGNQNGSGASTPTIDPAAKKAEEMRIAQEAAEKAAADKLKSAADKKVREAAKKNLKKSTKAIQASMLSSNYFMPADKAPTAKEIEIAFSELDIIFNKSEPEVVAELKTAVDANGRSPLVARAAAISNEASDISFKFFI